MFLHKVVRRLAFVPLTCLSVAAGARSIESVAYLNSAALNAAWVPSNADSPAPSLQKFPDGKVIRFELPFPSLKDWRFSWDRAGRWDLDGQERVKLKVRCGGGRPGQAILYAKAGDGWYRLPAFSLTPKWREVSLELEQAVREGSPGPWSSVERWRLSILPGDGAPAWAELASIRAESELPEVWVWQLGGARDKEQCFGRILGTARGPAFTDARRRLTQADGLLAAARRRGLSGSRRREVLRQARAKVAEAYALAQQPLAPGVRAVWVHQGDGPRAHGGRRAATWAEAVPAMQAMGINTIMPNMLWSGVAYYPSKLLPNAEGVAKEGDYLRQLLDAAHPRGLKVWVWKVMWQFAEGWLAPVGVSEPFRREGRLQRDASGKELPWLCPCDERNRAYEMDALLEVARNYDIDGVQLDYIRFDSPQAGFGPACRERFEKERGAPVEDWPAACAPGGALAEDYAEFRRGVISSFVQEASRRLREVRPDLTITAAVFAYPELARRQVLQDWPRWVKEGWIDYALPMTYTEDADSFAAATAAQAALVGADKLIPGIQVTYEHGRTPALEALVDQLKAAAALKTAGSALFEWREHLQDTVLPYVRNGLWREGAYELRFREVPAQQREVKVEVGEPLPQGRGPLRIDDFEDGDLVNELRAPWSAEVDANALGSRLDGQPLRPSQGGAQASVHALKLAGHYGHNRAPWPYALLATGFAPGYPAVDLRPFKALRFWARGDGKALELVLRRKAVTDYGDFRASVMTGPDWARYRLALKDFRQPDWAEPVPAVFSDVTMLIFQPGGRDDEDFWFEIDDVELER